MTMKSLGVVSPLRTMFIQERAECGMLRRQFVRRAVFAASIIAPESLCITSWTMTLVYTFLSRSRASCSVSISLKLSETVKCSIVAQLSRVPCLLCSFHSTLELPARDTSQQAGGLRRGIHPCKLEASGVGYIPASWRPPAWDTSQQAGSFWRGKVHCKTLHLISSLEPLARCWLNPNPGASIFETIILVNDPR